MKKKKKKNTYQRCLPSSADASTEILGWFGFFLLDFYHRQGLNPILKILELKVQMVANQESRRGKILSSSSVKRVLCGSLLLKEPI